VTRHMHARSGREDSPGKEPRKRRVEFLARLPVVDLRRS
jgi:hypothetical protein